ncbi:MAG TPA: hypothetical protein VNP91_14180 [Methylomirabilota bacterium]|nr:hypothetical protein [Methylomirabilota bacterium]
MKGSVGTVAVIGALSLVVWTAAYIFNPSTPLTQAETMIVVGVCAVLVFGFKWVVSSIAKIRGGNEPHS